MLRPGTAALALLFLLASCEVGMEPSNSDLGLRVWAEVEPRTVRIGDPDAVIRIALMRSNPSDQPIELVTGGPPYVFTPDPADSRGLLESFRIASATEPLNAGPGQDAWGQPVYRIPARTTYYDEVRVSLAEWRGGGWPLAPGVYRVRSYFNGREGESTTFNLVP